MNVVMFKLTPTMLLMKNNLPDNLLEKLRKDVQPNSVKATEAYMTYDHEGGVTVTLIFTATDVAKN